MFGEGGRTLGGGEGYGWTLTGPLNATFYTIVLGGLLGLAIYPLQERVYQRRLAANGGKSVPEARIVSALYLCWLMPIGCVGHRRVALTRSLTLFAWTCFPRIHFIVPLIGATLCAEENFRG